MTSRLSMPLEALQSATAGSIVYPPGGRFGPRMQRDIQLVMLYTGEMSVAVDGRELRAQPGQVVLLKPGREETFVFSRTEETWHRWIAVHVPELDEAAEAALDQLPECLPLTEEMNRLVDLMLNVRRQTATTDPLLRSLGLAALHLYPAESDRTRRQQEKHPAVYAALTWMRERYARDVSLREMAAHAGVSPEHLVRLFRQSERTTPMQYLWRLRVERAVELMTGTGLTVAEIALRCGFKTPHHLARLVKRTTGLTATEIRRRSWGGLRNP